MIDRRFIKVLIMGLSGSGKSTLSKRMKDILQCRLLNADEVRAAASDWDMSPEGRIRQAKRMHYLANENVGTNRVVLIDFICPTKETRSIFNADITIWLDTVTECKYEDTNLMFERPDVEFEKIECIVNTKDAQYWAKHIIEKIIPLW